MTDNTNPSERNEIQSGQQTFQFMQFRIHKILLVCCSYD